MSANRCPKCGASMIGPKGENQIICAACAARKSHEALLGLQVELLSKIAWDHKFRLLRRAGTQEWHVEFLGPYRGQAFCGVLFENPAKRSEWITRIEEIYAFEGVANLCAKCAATLKERVAAAAPLHAEER